MKNWKTTLFGTGGLVVVAVAALSAMFDNDPLTNPDWGLVIGAASAAIAFFFTKDKNVTGGTTQQ